MGCRGHSGDLNTGVSDSKSLLFIFLLSQKLLKPQGCGHSPHLWGFAGIARPAWKALYPLLQLIPFLCSRLFSSLLSSGRPFLLTTLFHPRHLGSCPWMEWLMPLSDYWSSLGDGSLWDCVSPGPSGWCPVQWCSEWSTAYLLNLPLPWYVHDANLSGHHWQTTPLQERSDACWKWLLEEPESLHLSVNETSRNVWIWRSLDPGALLPKAPCRGCCGRSCPAAGACASSQFPYRGCPPGPCYWTFPRPLRPSSGAEDHLLPEDLGQARQTGFSIGSPLPFTGILIMNCSEFSNAPEHTIQFHTLMLKGKVSLHGP